MRVGLINFNRKGVREHGIPPVPPIGLEYLVDDLEGDGHSVDLLDLCFVGRADRRDAVQTFAARHDVIGITFRNFGVDCLWLPPDDQFFVPELKAVVGLVRDATRAPIVLGGQGFAVAPERILQYVGADYGVAGPGELAFKSLLADLGRLPRGTVIRGAANLDIIHRRTLIDYDAYIANGGSPAIATKFGCPMSCNYCLEQRRPMFLRRRETVLEELRLLASRRTSFMFVAEPEFNNHLRHALGFCDALLELAAPLQWTTYLYPVPLTHELVRQMKRTGCVNPCISIGSGNDDVLAVLENKFTVEHIRRMAGWFHDEEFPFTVDLLFGAPGDTVTTAEQTIRLMEEIAPAVVGMNVGIRIYPHTNFARRFRAGEFGCAGFVHGHTDKNDDFFQPIYYISDPRIRDYLIDRCAGDERYRLLGHGTFGGVNYKVALGGAR